MTISGKRPAKYVFHRPVCKLLLIVGSPPTSKAFADNKQKASENIKNTWITMYYHDYEVMERM